MNKGVGKGIFWYFSSILLIVFSAVAVGGYYFWSHGVGDISKVASLFETSHYINEFKNYSGIDEVKKLVGRDRVKEAYSELIKWDSAVKTIQSNGVGTDDDIFNAKVVELKAKLKTLMSSSSSSTVVIVLSKKASKFEHLAVTNNWRTLTRIARRVSAKLSPYLIQ